MREFGLPLFAADVRDDLSRFHLLHYGGKVDGFLISGHNSGTHWLRFMLSSAIAHRLALPRPTYSSGPQSDVYIGHARHPRKHPQAPRIGSAHHMPSRLIALLGALRLARLPPVVLLVRDIPDSLISYFFKWREIKQLGALDAYVARPPSAQGVDLWWFIRFFNRWGVLRRVFPQTVMVVRYEDVEHDPELWVRRIWAHWGVELSDADVAAGLAVSSREAVAAHLDPDYGEDIAPDRAARGAVRYAAGDAKVLAERLTRYLRHDFGYAGVEEAAEPSWIPVAAPAREGAQQVA
ncbi:sulfotransferase domain-containing protein [Phenylobacterium sp.]|uniref:sulfotransferase domain-containing protein n=1 Tax=Phenylobacterium sp. TaxID=1871053 RepID=UPI003564D061